MTIVYSRKLGKCRSICNILPDHYYESTDIIRTANGIMGQDNIQSNSSISSDVEQVAYDSVCTCKMCNHGSARDCSKSGCKCCKKENHSMVMDGIEGFYSTDK